MFKMCMTLALGIISTLMPWDGFTLNCKQDWQLGPFKRINNANPILSPNSSSLFRCPIQNKWISWEAEHVFNPGAVVRNGKVYLFYRAEDDYGKGIGNHTSRIGLAISEDGKHFKRTGSPILFPNLDDQGVFEFPGGCEDPRIVETEEGTYVMMYTQWNRQKAHLGVATSDDLMRWTKHGYVFGNHPDIPWSKSGSIVCQCIGDQFIASKIKGKYWMYWGEGIIYAATSDDLISWDPIYDECGKLLAILEPRDGKFDSQLVEAGPPAMITKEGILLLYNGKNSITNAYSAGQVLFDLFDPTKVTMRCENYFLTPEKSYEMNGQYQGGTVFIQGLVHFHNKWFLYYGTADSAIGVAACK